MKLALYIVQLITGSALGFLISFAIFDLGGKRYSTVLLSVLIGSAMVILRYFLQDRAKWIDWAGGILALSLGIISIYQLYSIGFIAPLNQDKLKNFNRLSAAIETSYPYFEEKGIQWNQIEEKYRNKVINAKGDNAYFIVLAEMMAELRDGHASLISPRTDDSSTRIGLVKKIDGKAVVTAINPRISEIEAGTVILERDGIKSEEYIKGLDPWLASGSTKRQREAVGYLQLLQIPKEKPVSYLIQTPSGKEKKVILDWKTVQSGNESRGQGGQSVVTSEAIGDKLGLIKIKTFSAGMDVEKQFDDALKKLFQKDGIIIDLRGNGGGSTFVVEAVAGRFFDKSFAYAKEEMRKRLPLKGWARLYTHEIYPRGEIYHGKVAVLTDVYNMSAAEGFIMAMKDSNRAEIIGEQTGGAIGNPIVFNVPGGKVRFPIGDIRSRDGKIIEGVGIKPQIEIKTTHEDIRLGNDPVLEAAINYLKKGT